MKDTIIESLCFILCMSVFFFGLFIVYRYSDVDHDSFEKYCAVFYKENHYITKSCEEYRDKLENMVF